MTMKRKSGSPPVNSESPTTPDWGKSQSEGVVVGWPRTLALTKEQQVAEFLREAILSGQLVRGQKLKQDEIAKSLNISATPVREALKILETQGYVVGYSHRGMVVAPFDITKSEELFELRVQVEVRLARLAATQISEQDLEILTKLEQEIVAAAESGVQERMRRTNYRFHFQLYALAERPQTLEFVRVLWAKYPWDLVGVIPGRYERADAEHKAILSALRVGDATGTARALRGHIESNWREFKTAYPLHKTTEAKDRRKSIFSR
jgi:DNA-binding GntR family transcriptional regulator